MATAAAVTLGRREMLSAQTKEAYRRSGGAHLLAVSGLHVGFVYAIVGALLGFLLLVRNGQLWRSILLVGIMWIYVAVVGFSPSVVRAALMFSIMQIVVALSASAFSLNTLFGAAMIILWFSPQMLFDVGFLLSCLSVAAIVEWGVPLIFRIKTLIARGVEPQRTAWRGVVVYVLGWIVSAVVVSIVASLATMPLVAHQFGLTSLWGIVSGPLVVALCGVVVGVTLLWIILPIGFLAPVVGWAVESAASAMNSVAAWCAEREGFIFEGRISLLACVVIYLFYIVATVVVWSRERKKLPNL
jgi:competence protein ComEC